MELLLSALMLDDFDNDLIDTGFALLSDGVSVVKSLLVSISSIVGLSSCDDPLPTELHASVIYTFFKPIFSSTHFESNVTKVLQVL